MPHIAANGVQLFYDLRGPEAAPVAVFANSIGATHEMWDAQAAHLTGRFRCLRFDARGHGRSQTIGGKVGIEDLANDLAGLLDALGIEKAHIIGLSLGGMTAQVLALRHAAKVSSLTLMATSAHMPSNWEERAAKVRADGMASILGLVLARWFTPGFLAAQPGKVAPMRERFLASDPEGYALCCCAIQDMDLRADISAIKVPTLIIAGSEDPATPVTMMDEIRARIAGAEKVILPNCAHIPNIEQASAVNRHLQAFLCAHSQSGAVPAVSSSFEAGRANRTAVLGKAHVEASMAKADAFSKPWQEFITRNAWGDIWGDPALPWKTRSMLTLTMMVALHREQEFKLHLRPALNNGVTLAELRAMLLQTAVYAGVPAANAAFAWVKQVLGDELEAKA